jgi:hypothetical protein
VLHQPLIISFIAVGIVAGPNVLGIVEVEGTVQVLAQLGIALLLFIVGLKLDLRVIRTLGPVAAATGLGQVFFTSVVGYFIALALGFDPLSALYIGIALTFSSTIIIVKLLSDKGEIEQLHGRIAIGFLIVQDIVVVIVMILLSAFGAAGGGRQDLAGELALAVAVRGALFVGAIIAALVRWVLPPLLRRLAQTPELLVLFGIAWAAALAAGGDLLGFSEEVGAFLAGVSLASTPFREALATRLSTLRDFLLLFFFVELGALMDFADAASSCRRRSCCRVRADRQPDHRDGDHGRDALPQAGLVPGRPDGRPDQRVLAHLRRAGRGRRAHHQPDAGPDHDRRRDHHRPVDLHDPGLAPAVRVAGAYLGIFERSNGARHGPRRRSAVPKVIVFGLGRYGGHMIEELHAAGVPVMGVDFDPVALAQSSGWACRRSTAMPRTPTCRRRCRSLRRVDRQHQPAGWTPTRPCWPRCAPTVSRRAWR